MSSAMLMLRRNNPPDGFGPPYTLDRFRSAFRDWAAETTNFAGEVVEMALAYTTKNKAESAYRWGTLLEKRRQLLVAWADYATDGVSPPTPDQTT